MSGIETKLNRLGRDPEAQHGFINGPVYRGSTTVHKSVAVMEQRTAKYMYGTHGNPTVSNLQDAWNELTGAAGTALVPTGLAAVTLAILSVVKAGDNLLIVDSVYRPTRAFCDTVLARMGVTTTYYVPSITPNALRELLAEHPNTTVIFLESPGSQTFEVQDVPGLTAAARERGIVSIIDNTWATPIFFDALGRGGCDISVEAGTKYLGGHSDILLGLVAANAAYYPAIRSTYLTLGLVPGPEDCFLALRGMRTLFMRLKHAEARGLEVARWLEGRPEVRRVLHPALPSCPGHEFWKRDFTGATGLFSFELQPEYTKEQAVRVVDSLRIFQMGFSWGGFESLCILFDPSEYRTAGSYTRGGQMLRVQIGHESLDDLTADLDQALQKLKD